MSFGLYLMGLLLVLGGLIYGAAMLHVPTHWIAIFAVVALGLGIVSAVRATRQRDPAG
jgi:cadmium resistance protein CadD (predicted permease)